MEPLLRKIRATVGIKGMHISGREIKLSAYADDLAMVLDGSESSLRNAVNLFNEFRKVTGLQLNIGKTICSWIGSARHGCDPICQDLNLQWLKRGDALELLGVKVFADAQRTSDINYNCKLDEIEKAMSPLDPKKLNTAGQSVSC